MWALTKSCWCLYPEMLCFVHHSFVDEHACLWSDGQMVNGLVEEENGKAAGITHAQVRGTMGEGTRGAFETAQHYQGRGHMSVACDDSVSYHVPLRSKHLSSLVPSSLRHRNMPSAPGPRQQGRQASCPSSGLLQRDQLSYAPRAIHVCC